MIKISILCFGLFILPAAGLLAQSLQQLNVLADDTGKAERLLVFSKNVLKEDRHLADSAALIAFIVSEKINYPLGKAKALQQRARIISNNDYQQAENYLRTALGILTSPVDDKLIYETKKMLATNLVRQTKMEEASTLFREIQAYAMEEGIPELIGDAYLGLANIANAKSDFVDALAYYLKAAEIREEQNDKAGMAIIYNNIAINLKEQERYEESLMYHFKSAAIKKEQANNAGIASSYTNIGIIYNRLGKYRSALQYYMDAVALATTENDSKILSNLFSNIGVTYRHLLQPDSAIIFLKKSLVLKEKLNSQADIAGSYYNLAYAYFDKEEYVMSKSYLDKAEKVSTALQEKSLQAKILELRSKLFEADNNQKEALETFKRSVLVRDSIFNIEQSSQLQEILTRYETEKKDRQLAENKNQLQKSEAEITQRKFANYILSVSIAALAIILVVSVGYYLQRQKNLQHQKEIEKQRAIIDERNRIANDMHDDLGAGLSTIKMMGEIAISKPAGNNHVEMQKITQSASELIDNMRAIVWSMSSRNDELEDLILYSKKYAFEFLESHKIECNMHIPDDIPKIKLTAEQRRNIFLVMKESLHNTVKHANATHVEIDVKTVPVFAFTIHDNGKGVDTGAANRFGNGIKNMQRRMESIGGVFAIASDRGTTVTCECRFENNGST